MRKNFNVSEKRKKNKIFVCYNSPVGSGVDYMGIYAPTLRQMNHHHHHHELNNPFAGTQQVGTGSCVELA